jgi:endoglucanase
MRLSSFLGRRLIGLPHGLLLCAALACGSVAGGQGVGYWHTSGDRILDANDRQVRITGINWYGFESGNATVGGLYAQDYKSVLRTLKAQGFNAIRIPLSSQMIESPGMNLNIAYSNNEGPINTDLISLNSMQVLDRIVAYSGSLGLKVILDHHRSEAGNSAEGNGLWYTKDYPESAWIGDWTALASRYLGNSTVIGFDLHNEPHSVSGGGACWDCGGSNDWHLAAERAGNAVLSVNPKLLVFVEGVDAYQGDSYWWGGNLEGVQNSPIELAVAHQLVYSAHEYGPHESTQPWFTANTTYATLSSTWTKHWAYISQKKIAPVWLGEFGTTNIASDLQDDAAGSQGQWFQSLMAYLDADRNLNWSYWAVNGEDNYGLLPNGYSNAPASPVKLAMLVSSQKSSREAKQVRVSTAPESSPGSGSGGGIAWALVGGSGLTCALFYGKNQSDAEGLARAEEEQDDWWHSVKSPVSPGVSPVLKIAAASSSQITLSWLPSRMAGATYGLYVGTRPDSIGNVIATGLTSTSYLVTKLRASTGYFFVVTVDEPGFHAAASNVVMSMTEAVFSKADIEGENLTRND